MGRRYGISVTSLERFAASMREMSRRRERDALIAQSGGSKTGDTNIYLRRVEYNAQTRYAKVYFIEEKNYRTVEKYVTRNYVKYPIYSAWKTKKREISESIKLDNVTLEKLTYHSSRNIRNNAYEIISRIDNIDLPSWYVTHFYQYEYEEARKHRENEIKKKSDSFHIKKTELTQKIEKEKSRSGDLSAQRDEALGKREKAITKLDRVRHPSRTRRVFLCILTLGMYSKRIQAKKITALEEKIEAFKVQIDTITAKIDTIEKNIAKHKHEIEDMQQELEREKQRANEENEVDFQKMKARVREVSPLPMDPILENEFIPLKKLAGVPYKKIIGCYVIRNTKNRRCYVGQSKDVYKRIKQHFHGTEPANIIFAEDYYSVAEEKRPDLFEVKIFQRATKDELDYTERELIEQYDSYKNGYNGTAGNK